MKKVRFASAIIIVFNFILLGIFFASCNNFFLRESERKENEKAHKDFISHKNSWEEPQNYTFRYSYSVGDSYVGAEFVTVVTDGKGECTPNQYYRSSYDGIKLNTISQMYDYFNNVWDTTSEPDDTNYYLSYKVAFKEKAGVSYPERLSQSIGKYGACGYGGQRFGIRNFSLENYKTFQQKKAAWVEPDKPYSFTYSLYLYTKNGTSYSTPNVHVTVGADGKGNSDIRTVKDGSFVKEYGEALVEECELLSISAVFDYIEKFWSERNSSSSEYGYAQFFESQDSYGSYKIPASFECENFRKYKPSEVYADNSFNAEEILVSVRDFKINE